ncbi:MAG: hypothetical protein WAW41_13940 [Methylobacter sp.]
MEGMDLKNYAVIVSGCITAISTLSAVVITSWFNHKITKLNIDSSYKQKLIEYRLSKIEELYLLFEKWETTLSNIYLLHLRCYTEHLTYAQVLELAQKDNLLLLPGEAQKLKMLLNIHFQELLADFQYVDKTRGNLAPYLDDPKKNKLSAQNFCLEQTAFENACKDFKQKLSQLSVIGRID